MVSVMAFPESVTLGQDGVLVNHDPFALRLAESANARSALVLMFLSRTDWMVCSSLAL